jgi:acyl carrier protein
MPGVACIDDLIRKFIAENFLYREATGEFSDTQSFLEAGLIDSTGILELVFFLENTFHIHVTDDEVVPENLDSIQQIAAYIRRKTAKQNTVQEIPDAPRALSA